MIRASLIGAGIGGGAFLVVGLYLNHATGSSPLSHPGPVGVLVVIGATVGGLVAPLFRRWRTPNPSDPDGREG